MRVTGYEGEPAVHSATITHAVKRIRKRHRAAVVNDRREGVTEQSAAAERKAVREGQSGTAESTR